jgi:acyl-CoA synthetase (NDP forming)
VDLIASATAYHYHATIEIVARDANVDAIVVIFIPPLVTKPEDVAQAIVDGTRALAREKPVLTVFMQSRGVPPVLRAADVRVPSYSFPENAAMALARVAEYGEWLARPVPVPARLEGVRREEATAVVSAAVARGGGWLDPHDVWQVLTAYGLPMLPQRIVGDADAAARAAMEMGGAVALKAIAPGLVHKTEAGAVRIGLTADQVRAAALEMQEGLRGQAITPAGFLVQQMAVPGVEMIVGVVHDRQFGTVLACGAGGVLVELVKDVAVRLTPVSELDAMEMVRDLKTWPLLAGYRGGAPHDVSAVVDAIVRVSALAEDIPEIAELDLNPILVHERHATIVDARIRVSEVTPPSA